MISFHNWYQWLKYFLLYILRIFSKKNSFRYIMSRESCNNKYITTIFQLLSILIVPSSPQNTHEFIYQLCLFQIKLLLQKLLKLLTSSTSKSIQKLITLTSLFSFFCKHKTLLLFTSLNKFLWLRFCMEPEVSFDQHKFPIIFVLLPKDQSKWIFYIASNVLIEIFWLL